jgi:hypothetical protein
MKKAVLVLTIFISLTFYSFSQQKDSAQYVTNTNVEKLIDKYSEKIEASVAAFSEKLKQQAEHIYSVLIKQQVISGYIWLATLVVGLVFLIFGILLVFKFDPDDEFLGGVGLVFIVIFGLMFIIGIIGFLGSGLSGLLNPEYGAMKDIVSFFK